MYTYSLQTVIKVVSMRKRLCVWAKGNGYDNVPPNRMDASLQPRHCLWAWEMGEFCRNPKMQTVHNLRHSMGSGAILWISRGISITSGLSTIEHTQLWYTTQIDQHQATLGWKRWNYGKPRAKINPMICCLCLLLRMVWTDNLQVQLLRIPTICLRWANFTPDAERAGIV